MKQSINLPEDPVLTIPEIARYLKISKSKIYYLVSTKKEIPHMKIGRNIRIRRPDVQTLRGWAIPIMIPISQVWRSIDKNGQPLDPNIDQQLRSLGTEVVRAARQFADDEVSDYYEAGELARQ